MNLHVNVKTQAGFTLIESMIAMFFVAFMAGEMGMVMTYASRNSNLSQRIIRANALADDAIEKSRNTAYNNIQYAISSLNETCAADGLCPSCIKCTSSLDGGRFTRERVIAPRDNSFPPGYATLATSQKADVDVTVLFTDARGNSQQVRVATIVARK